jgi:hypothetical protein
MLVITRPIWISSSAPTLHTDGISLRSDLRRGWSIRLNPYGTTTAVTPDRRKTLHSHSPPLVA